MIFFRIMVSHIFSILDKECYGKVLLLKFVGVSGCIITIDAMRTQKKIAKTIMEKDGDYILAVKENHKTLYNDTALFLKKMESMKKEGFAFDEYETVAVDHGRIETRKYVMTSDIDWLHDKENWTGLKSLGRVESSRDIKGECSHEKRYYISSLDCDAKKF
ncbi:MAG: ISAs1 family transposase [Pseudomonadota bacterium]